MFSQHASKSAPSPIRIEKVSCEKTGTIYYRRGLERAWTKQALIKSDEHIKK